MTLTDKAKGVALIVRDAGGRVVGRTKLQKIAYLLTASGLESRYRFAYKHYGPFSEDLASLTGAAKLLGFISEKTDTTRWGGTYSIYAVEEGALSNADAPQAARVQLANIAAASDAVELELAATAVFLFKDGHQDPWAETARRKPEKALNGRLEGAKRLYARLQQIETPERLPPI